MSSFGKWNLFHYDEVEERVNYSSQEQILIKESLCSSLQDNLFVNL